ncbi:MAG: hypothetical protein LM522_06195 [Candidatus Contendobacter sp.]|nr:hypothetical protein [Candidatus Contendobacter sp.]
MTARVLNFPDRRPGKKATLPASVVSSTVYHSPDGPLLEITLTARLADVPPLERRKLVEVLHRGQPLTVTLGGEGPIRRPGSIRKSPGEWSGGDDAG